MSEHSDRAVELFKSGYNCSQSVFAAFCDKTGLPQETALRVAAGFGGGIGRMREVCGAVCGATMLAGMVCGATRGDDREAKARTYEKVQEIANRFRADKPSIICRELLGLSPCAAVVPTPEARTESYYKKRPCVKLVEEAALIAEAVLFSEEQE